MSIDVTFHFNSHQEFLEFAGGLCKPSCGPITDVPQTIAGSDGAPVTVNAAEPDAESPQATPKRRGRPAKVQATADGAPPPAPAPAVTEAVAGPALTKDDIRAALGALNSVKGLSECQAMLARFGAQRIPEVKAEDYAAFIQACKDAAAAPAQAAQ